MHSHPKFDRAEARCLGATGLWVRAGSWACANLTDGFIPEYWVQQRPGGPEMAAALVKVKLWVRRTKLIDGTREKGYEFWQWSERNLDADTEKARRRADSARQKVLRDKPMREAIRNRDDDLCRYCGRVTHFIGDDQLRFSAAGGTYDHVIPDGPTDEDNLVVCCRSCNSKKKRRTPSKARMPLLAVGTRLDEDGRLVTPDVTHDNTCDGTHDVRGLSKHPVGLVGPGPVRPTSGRTRPGVVHPDPDPADVQADGPR